MISSASALQPNASGSNQEMLGNLSESKISSELDESASPSGETWYRETTNNYPPAVPQDNQSNHL